MDRGTLQELGARARLFVKGERLGWAFRDRHQDRRPFAETPPDPEEGEPDLEDRVRRMRAEREAGRPRGRADPDLAPVVLAVFGALVAAALGLVIGSLAGGGAGAAVFAGTLALASLPLLGGRLRRRRLESRLRRAHHQAEERRQARHSGWRARADEHERNERRRVDRLPEWGAVEPPPEWRRLDLFGGNLWGWEAFLTVFGTSLLATSPPLAVIDLSEEGVSRELAGLAARAGFAVDRQALPADMERCDLLEGLDGGHLAELLVESISGDEQGATRAGRAMDTRVLSELCRELSGAGLTMGRLREALSALLGEPGEPELLSRQEWDRVASELFSADYVKQAHERLRRLEAFLHPLRRLAARPRAGARDAQLRVLEVSEGGVSAQGDLLIDLVAQRALRDVTGAGAPATRVLVVAGADRLPRRQLERLADACERRQVRLVLMCRHLRDETLKLLGGGTAVFMRLGNHQEAEQAAGYIGRGHRFVVSQLAVSQGGNETHTFSTSDSGTQGTSVSTSDSHSTSRHSGTSRNANETAFGSGLSRFALGHTSGSSEGQGSSRTRGSSEGTSWSRTWGTSESHAEGTSWSDSRTSQRVYEYRVEPTVLQSLPDYALLLVEQTPAGLRLQAAECDPNRVFLPRLLMGRLPEVEPAAVPAQPEQPAPPERPAQIPSAQLPSALRPRL